MDKTPFTKFELNVACAKTQKAFRDMLLTAYIEGRHRYGMTVQQIAIRAGWTEADVETTMLGKEDLPLEKIHCLLLSMGFVIDGVKIRGLPKREISEPKNKTTEDDEAKTANKKLQEMRCRIEELIVDWDATNESDYEGIDEDSFELIENAYAHASRELQNLLEEIENP